VGAEADEVVDRAMLALVVVDNLLMAGTK